MLLDSIDAFNNMEFVKFIISDQDRRVFWRLVFEAQCETAVELSNIGKEKAGSCDGHEMDIAQFLLWFQEDFGIGLREMGTEKVQKVLEAATA